MAPTEAMATRPKASASERDESFFMADTPAAIAKTKGTVSAPVVAPEASKDTAKYSGGAKTAKMPTSK